MKDRFGRNASAISREKSEIDVIMEDYLERKEEQERESEKISDKTAKDKASAEEMRNKTMERLGETKKRAGDLGGKENIQPNKTMDYLREATEKECELKKKDLEFRKKQREGALAQKNLMFSTTARNVHVISRPVEKSTTAVPDDVSKVYAATTTTKPSTT